MRNFVIGLLGSLLLIGPAAVHAQVKVDFSSAPGDLGPTHTYGTSLGNVVASGWSDTLFGSPTDLYGKNLGGNENGLGLAADPSGQNEIYFGNAAFGAFVELDVSGILNSTSSAQFFMNSTTDGEGWEVFGTNVAGCGFLCGASVAQGSDQGSLHSLTGWGTYQFYDFYSTGTGYTCPVGCWGTAPGNSLLGALVLTAVPEPGTWAMMLVGFGMIGLAMRRRQKVHLASA